MLFAPADAFEDIVRKPDILAPLLIILAIGYACTAVLMPRLDYEAVRAMNAEQLRKQQPNMTDADIARFERYTIASMKVFAWLGPLFMTFFYAAAAGLFLLAFRLMGGQGNYTQAMSVMLYAWIPLVLYSVVTAIVVLARGSFDPSTAATLVKSNPAFLVEMREQPVLYSLLSSLDVFSVWTLILLTFGFAALAKLPRALSAAIVFGLWGAMVLVKLGFAAMQA
ncbi:MAG TPA: YIP1 family protein [Thermoanaerobaculia bacterium]